MVFIERILHTKSPQGQLNESLKLKFGTSLSNRYAKQNATQLILLLQQNV
jgi:hypothetical protein